MLFYYNLSQIVFNGKMIYQDSLRTTICVSSD